MTLFMATFFLVYGGAHAYAFWKARAALNPGLRSSLSFQPGTSFAIASVFSILISVYGYFEAGQVRIEQVTIRSPKIPAEAGRVRIVQISDVHLGLIVREQRLKRIIRKVMEAGPDLLVSTGDLVDGQMDNLDGLSEILAGIRPRYGKLRSLSLFTGELRK